MALWKIDRAEGRISLSYVEKPLDPEPEVKECGESDDVVLPDLMLWVCGQADPFDMVETADGHLFVRQHEVRGALLQ